MTYVSLAIEKVNDPEYPYGKLPPGSEPKELKPLPEMSMGRVRKSKVSESLADNEESL